MRPRRAMRAGAVALLAGGLLIGSPIQQAGAEPRPAERKVFRLTNKARINRDRPRVKLNRRMSRIARRHSREMLDAGGLYHRDPLSTGLGGMRWSVLGENVGRADSARRVHRLFMDSRPHRRNILKPAFRKVGIGTVKRDGTVWTTVIFLG